MAEENNTPAPSGSDFVNQNENFVAMAGASQPTVDIAQATNTVNPFRDRVSSIRQKYNIGQGGGGSSSPQVNLPRNTTMGDISTQINMQTPAIDGIEKSPIPTPQSALDNYLDAVDTYGMNVQEDVFATTKNIKANFRDPHHQNQFYDRYANHEQFQNLGFNPFQDNESLYNANTSTWQEIKRASSQWMTLTGLGFADAAGFGDLSDRDVARKYEKAMAIGSSSIGGVGGFTSNLYLNSGYTVGIMAELAVEEAAMLAAEAGLVALTVGSLGTAAPATGTAMAVTGATMAARAGRAINKIGKAWKYSSKLGKAADTAYDLTRTLTNFKDASKARKFFTSAGKNLGKLVNPLEGTMDFARNFNKMGDVHGVVKAAKGFGAFYKDIRNVRLAYGEGALEGGMVENEMSRDLYESFVSENNRQPNDDEAAKIRETARSAGRTTALINAPVIMLSNKLTFDGLVRPRFSKIGSDFIEAGLGKKILFNPKAAAGQVFSKVPAMYNIPKVAMTYARNPKLIYRGLSTYGKANVAEGLQEIAQETIGGASKEYYTAKYAGNAMRGGYMANTAAYLGATANNLGKQFSAQGAETFLSGFLMGGFISPVSNTIAAISPQNLQQEGTFLNNTILKFTDKAAYAKTKAERDASFNNTLESLNELYEDPNKYFSPDLENTIEQKEYVEGMNQSQKNGDKKTYYDLKNAAGQKHILTALKMGRVDTFNTRMEELKQLSAEEVEKSYNMPKEQFDKQLDNSLAQSKEIERRYNLGKEKYKNPFSPEKYKTGTVERHQEQIRKNSWNAALEEMIFKQGSFDNALSRKKDILNNLKDVSGLEKTSASDFAHIESLKSMETESTTLKGEIESYGNLKEITDPSIKKTVEYKKAKLAAIEKYRNAVQKNVYENTSEDESLTPEQNKEISDAFVEYAQVVAKESGDFTNIDKLRAAAQNNTDAQFLGTRAEKLNQAVNTLLEPEDFINHVERITELNTNLYLEKSKEIKKSLEAFLKLKDTNDMLGQLANDLEGKNMFIDPDALVELMKTGEVPKEIFYIADKGDMKAGTQVAYTSNDYGTAIEIFSNYAEHVHGKVIGQEERNPTMLKQHREKMESDQRTYADYAAQFGFDPKSASSNVPLSQVLTSIIESEYATPAEIELAKKLLENVDKNETVTFVNTAKREGSYTPTTQSVIDARYSSKDFGKDSQNGPALETVILKQELSRRVSESLEKDKPFQEDMGKLLVEAQEAFNNLSMEDRTRLFGDATKIPLGLTNLENFTLSSMNDSGFQTFLAMSPSTKATTTSTKWQNFIKAVIDQINKILNIKSNGTILNAAMDIITTQIDSKYSISGTKGKTAKKTVKRGKTAKPGQMTVEKLMEVDDGALADLVYEDFMRINRNKVEDNNEPLLKDFDSMSKEEIMDSAQFASFVESPMWKNKEDIIKSYEVQSEETVEEEVQETTDEEVDEEENESKITEYDINDITNEEYNAFLKDGSKGVSTFAIYKLAEKVKSRANLTQQEATMLADTGNGSVMRRVNYILTEMGKGYPKSISTSMKRQMKMLGYPKDIIKGMNAATMQTYIWQGLTLQDRQAMEKAKNEVTPEVKQEVYDFENNVNELFNSVKTKQELEQIEDRISEEYNDLSYKAAKLVNLTQEDINTRKKQKLQELAFSIKISDISVGEFLSLNNKSESIVEVIAKDADGITVKYKAGKQSEFTISNKEIADKIKYRYSEALEQAVKEEKQEITPADVEQAVGSQENAESLDNSGTAVKEEIEAAKEKQQEETDNDFLDKIC